jgi:hypothetical protein
MISLSIIGQTNGGDIYRRESLAAEKAYVKMKDI